MLRRLIGTCGMAVFLLLATSRLAPAEESKAEKKTAGKATIPVFKIHGSLSETPADDSFPLFGGAGQISFKDLVARLKKSGSDPAVKAVVLLAEGDAPGSAQMEELRQVMAQIRQAGKDIYVHADSMSMREYVLFSGATRISVVPTGDLWITGLYGESPYIRGLLNKLGVKPDFLTCGTHKSAAELFMREGPSKEADEMQNWLLDSTFGTFVDLIAKGRNVDAPKVKGWIDGGPYTAEQGLIAGIIDAVEHRGTFTEHLKEKYGKTVSFNHKYGDKKGPDFDFSSPLAMFQIWGDLLSNAGKKKSGKDAVAIVYVDGAISLGGGGEVSPFGMSGAGSTSIRKALDEAANDKAVKAVVLRVNSPGGSAVASEIILDATRRVKAKKPFVVSMGDVAGSGGYYVACAADVVFADAATITGSIGVVSGKLVTTDMWNKVGITFKAYKRGANAGMLNSSTTFSPEERSRMQGYMDEIYGVFKAHVTESRGPRLKKPLDEIAGGRVYTGKQALELGLVDKIGSLEDAIHFIAAEAKLKDYDIRVVPEPQSFIEKIIEEASGGKDDSKSVRAPVGGQTSLVDLALPHLRGLDPHRVQLIKAALQRLQLLQQEGAILMMPEFSLGR